MKVSKNPRAFGQEPLVEAGAAQDTCSCISPKLEMQ